ncbi:MAG: GTP cyclohydrolase I FolE [Clostridia bacterium]|nr:GTP cyclohydrolase I FolE [Clostridia bacterium]
MDKEKIERAVRDILEAIGEDPDREGLKETPKRVANMYEEILGGINQSAEEHLKIFNEPGNDEMVIVRDIPLYSMCEHHLLPFVGKAHIAYIPNEGRIIGLSKLARIVNVYAKRLQVQERLTAEVADFLYIKLGAKSVAVIIEAEHLCMTMRGARAAGAKTETSALRGYVRNDAKLRAEVMSLLTGGR